MTPHMQTDEGQKSWALWPNNHHICRDQCEQWTPNLWTTLTQTEVLMWQYSWLFGSWAKGMQKLLLAESLGWALTTSALPGLRRAHCSLQISTCICSDVQTYVIYIGFTTEEILPCPRVPNGWQDVDGAQPTLLLHPPCSCFCSSLPMPRSSCKPKLLGSHRWKKTNRRKNWNADGLCKNALRLSVCVSSNSSKAF